MTYSANYFYKIFLCEGFRSLYFLITVVFNVGFYTQKIVFVENYNWNSSQLFYIKAAGDGVVAGITYVHPCGITVQMIFQILLKGLNVSNLLLPTDFVLKQQVLFKKQYIFF